MARLFITPREIDFIADITKEITKDVIGQVIYYYKPRIDLSKVHDVYGEASERVFDPPVEIDCRVQWGGSDLKQDRFGQDKLRNIQVYVHYRDLIDRNIKLEEGLIDKVPFGPTEEKYLDDNAIQKKFVQQRGDDDRGDKRALVSDGVLDAPIAEGQVVQETENSKSSFYGDDS